MYQENYDPASIEKKWQKIWAETHAFEAENDYSKPKFYGLIEFPYPSGAGLHVGDVYKRQAPAPGLPGRSVPDAR